MDVSFYGANCVKISTKKASVVMDDNMASVGKKNVVTSKDIVINSSRDSTRADGGLFVVDSSGEYEISEVSIKGIPTKLHYDPEKPAVMYSLHVNGFSIAVLGHTVADLSDKQIEEFGVVDILVLPVGGGGYTLDSVEAIKLVKEFEPKIVVPTHYSSETAKYEVEQAPIDEFLKVIGSLDVEHVDTLKLKDINLPEKTRIIVIKEQ